jgi:LPS-assembly protein
VLSSPLAYGQETPYLQELSTEKSVTVKADRMYYDYSEDLYSAEGNVIIEQTGAILRADTITLNTLTRDAQATGNVTLAEGENILSCERLDINLITKVGTVSQATLFIKENNYRISGESFEKLGESKYTVVNGTVTTCGGDVPAWKITGGHIDVTLEGFASIKNSTFQVRNIPILYSPFFFYPVKIKRQSGFLMPQPGFSSSDGVKLNNSFYWAVSDSTDATLYLDYTSKKGVGEGAEFRYVLNETSKGKIYQYYTEERSEYFEDEYDELLGRHRKRGLAGFEGEHYFSETSYTKAIATWLSDRQILQDYGRELSRFDVSWDTVSLTTLEKNKSFLFYTKNWSQYTVTGQVEYFKDLENRNSTTLQRLPTIHFSGERQKIQKTPLFFKIDSAYDYFNRDRGVKGQRLDLFPKLSLPINIKNYVKITPEIGTRGMFALDLSDNSSYDRQETVLDAHVELSTTILKIYNLNGKRIAKLKHSIEPSIFYSYISNGDQDEFPFFEPLDRFYARQALTYALTNRLTAKVLQPDGSFAEQEVGYFRVAQNYYFTDPDLTWYYEGYNGHDFSDVLTELRLRLSSYAFFRGTLQYNPYDNNLSEYDTLLSLENKRNDYLRFEYHYLRDRYDGYRIWSRFKLSQSWAALFETRSAENKTLDSIYGLEYFAQCWSIRLNVEDKSKQSGKKSKMEYSLLFTLAGLGGLGGFEGSLD